MNVPRPSRFAGAAAGVLVLAAALFPLAGGYLKAQPQTQADAQAQAADLFQNGVSLLNQKDYDEAMRNFRRAHELDPQNSRWLLGMVEVEVARGHNDEAIALLEQESARYPRRIDLQLALGNTAVRTGKYDTALGVFQNMLASIDSNSSDASDIHLRLGETYRRMKDYPQAIAELRRAVELKPDAPVPLVTLAIVLETSGQAEAAQEAYRGVLQLDPNNGVARNNLSYLIASHGGNLDEALKLAQEAKAIVPQAEVDDTLGYIYLKRKQTAESFSAYRDAVLQRTAERTFRDHMLEALAQMDHPPANADALKAALAAEPSPANQELVRKLLQ